MTKKEPQSARHLDGKETFLAQKQCRCTSVVFGMYRACLDFECCLGLILLCAWTANKSWNIWTFFAGRTVVFGKNNQLQVLTINSGGKKEKISNLIPWTSFGKETLDFFSLPKACRVEKCFSKSVSKWSLCQLWCFVGDKDEATLILVEEPENHWLRFAIVGVTCIGVSTYSVFLWKLLRKRLEQNTANGQATTN